MTHPILRLEIVRVDGTRATLHRVFCARERRSVLVERCCACIHCERVVDEPAPAVVCAVPPAGDDEPEVGAFLREGAVVLFDEGGETIEITDELGAPTSCALVIHERTPLRTALGALAAAELHEAAVVDDHGVPLGVFRAADAGLARTRTP